MIFISLLASCVAPVVRRTLAKRISCAMLSGHFTGNSNNRNRPHLGLVMATPIFWAKIAFPLCLMIGALSMVMRLARLGIVSGPGKMLIVAAVASAWVGSIYVLLVAPPDDRVAIILGQTWKVCVLNITLLSIPGFIGVFLGATRSCIHQPDALRSLRWTTSRLNGNDCLLAWLPRDADTILGSVVLVGHAGADVTRRITRSKLAALVRLCFTWPTPMPVFL